MAKKTVLKRAKRAANGRLDLPMSALAAGSVAFAAWAMPGDLFSAWVAASGLPSVLAAAEPPLGDTARMAAAAAGGAATFAIVWMLLRALGRPAKAKAEEPDTLAAPRLRRADAHPDAPSRRPLFAGIDLGEPTDELPFHDEPIEDEQAQFAAGAEDWERSLPGFLAAEGEAEAEAEAGEGEAETHELDTEADGDERFAAEADDEEAEPGSGPGFASASEPEPSIPDLMQRLELGIIRRQGNGWDPAAAPLAGGDVDDRLRSAIDDLQKMARRG